MLSVSTTSPSRTPLTLRALLPVLTMACALAAPGTGQAQPQSAPVPLPQVSADEAHSPDELLESGRVALRGGDFDGARHVFEALAAAGHVRAVGYLAEMTEQGWGMTRNLAAAASLYRRAGEAGDQESRARLGLLLARAERDLPSASVAPARPALVQGGAVSLQLSPGGARGVEGAAVPVVSSLAEGLTLIDGAAAAGDAFGQYALGRLQFEGMLVSRDEDRALRLIEAAARQDLPEALRHTEGAQAQPAR